MYGFVFEAIKAGVIENYSSQVWYTISEITSTPIEYEKFSDYDEQILMDLGDGFAKHFRFTFDNAMEYFGMWYIKYIMVTWNMKSIARCAFDFFKCWNDFMNSKRTDFPRMFSIIIRVYPESRQGYRLTAVLESSNNAKFVLGLVTYVNNYPFRKSTTSSDLDKVTKSKAKITLVDISKKVINNKLFFFHNINVQMDNQQTFEDDYSLVIKKENIKAVEEQYFDKIFPFYIYFDKDGKILRVGPSMHNILPSIVGEVIHNIFSLEVPVGATFDIEYLSIITDTISILASTINLELVYRFIGQFIIFEEHNTIIFIARPTMEMYETKSVYLSDSPIYDVNRNIWLSSLLKASKVAIAYEESIDRNKLLEKKVEEQEQENSAKDDLLYAIMPSRVIDMIRGGDVPFSETIRKRSNVAVIFCDLCGFTKLSGTLQPMQVAKVMSSLWKRFDNLTHELENVQKIETIGDAYVAASGVPDPCEKSSCHAAILAIAMSVSIQTLELDFLIAPMVCRIGIDLGDVVAGVVGSKNPRYSIYGETVINAQKLESYSKPRCILVSKSMYTALNCYREFRLKEAKDVQYDKQVYWLYSYYDVAVEKVNNNRQAIRNLDRLKERVTLNSEAGGRIQVSSTITNSSGQSKVSYNSNTSHDEKVSIKSSCGEDSPEGPEECEKGEAIVEGEQQERKQPKPTLLSRISSSDMMRGFLQRFKKTK